MARPRFKAITRPAAIALGVGTAVVLGAFGLERVALHATRNDRRSSQGPVDPWKKHGSKGLTRPAVVSADAAEMSDEEVVLGVEVRGKARAYRLDALRDRDRHVINDVVGQGPLTVTYCDITDCVQAYTDAASSDAHPLDVELVGLHDGEMVIKVAGTLVLQRTNTPMAAPAGPSPYATVTPVRTTWGDWRRRHPGTDVYVGPR